MSYRIFRWTGTIQTVVSFETPLRLHWSLERAPVIRCSSMLGGGQEAIRVS